MISTDPSLENISIDGTPFNVLMQHAMAMKTEQLAVDRRKYDSWPSWLRNSLIVSDEIKTVRKVPSFAQRLEIANAFEKQASMRYKLEDFDGAIIFYEKALGMWEWVETSVEDWRRTPIRDCDLTIHRYEPSSPSEKATVILRRIMSLLSLAAAAIESKQWARCIEACTAAIDLDPRCAKAYHRRGKARVLPLSAGTVDLQMALKDFETAVEIDPIETRFQQDYFALRSQLNKQKLKDKKTFGNFFERAKYLDEEESSFLQLQETQQKKKKVSAASSPSTNLSNSIGNNETFSRDQLRHILKNIDEAIEKAEISLKHAQFKHDRLVLQRDQLTTEENEQPEEVGNCEQDTLKQLNEIELQLSLLDEEMKELNLSLSMWQEKKKSMHDVLYRAIAEHQLQEEQTKAAQIEVNQRPSQHADTSRNDGNKPHRDSSGSAGISTSEKSKIALKDMDFKNPTQEMIDDAKAHGIDITDPTIQQLLLRRQKEHQEELKQGKNSTKIDHSSTKKKKEEEEAKLVNDAFHQEAVDIAEKILADSREFSMRLMLFTRCTYGIEALITDSSDSIDSNVDFEWLKVYRDNSVVKKLIDRVQTIMLCCSEENESEKKQNDISWFSAFAMWCQGWLLDCGPSKSIWEEEFEVFLVALALVLEAQDLGKSKEHQRNDQIVYENESGDKRVKLFSHEEIRTLLRDMLTEDFEHCYRTFQVPARSATRSKNQHQTQEQEQEQLDAQQLLWSQCLEKTMNRYYHTIWEDESFLSDSGNNNANTTANKTTANIHTSFVLSTWPQTFLRYARFTKLYHLPDPHRHGHQCEHVRDTPGTQTTMQKKEHFWWQQLHWRHIVVLAVILTWCVTAVYFLTSNLSRESSSSSSAAAAGKMKRLSSFSHNAAAADSAVSGDEF